jgi:hypothetical protein
MSIIAGDEAGVSGGASPLNSVLGGPKSLFSKRNRKETNTEAITKRCSFCNKDEPSVRTLIAGPTV